MAVFFLTMPRLADLIWILQRVNVNLRDDDDQNDFSGRFARMLCAILSREFAFSHILVRPPDVTTNERGG